MLRVIGGIERQVIFNEGREDGGGGSVTFSAVDLGESSPGRVIIVGVTGGGSLLVPDITAVSLGGAAMTKRVTGSFETVGIWTIENESDASADLAVTIADGSFSSVDFACWSAYGLQSETPHATGFDESTGDTNSVTIAMPGDGIGVAIAYSRHGTTPTHTWTGDVSENYDANFTTGASVSHASAGTMTATVQTTGDVPFMAAATWS